MTEILISIGVLLALIAANGVFAMAEMAFVSVRQGRLQQMADGGHGGAKVALELIASPNRFLATVQVGITLIGIVAGAYGGAELAKQLALMLNGVPWIAPYSGPVSFIVVVSLITFLSLVVGELVPKRLALSKPLGLTLLLARPMRMLSSISAPVISLLGNTTDLVLGLFGVRSEGEPVVTAEEVKAMVEQGHHAGVFHKAEIRMVERVMRLDSVRVDQIMTPMPRVVWLGVDDSDEVNWRKIVASSHTYFPVYEKQRQNVLGVVSVKSMWANQSVGVGARLKDLLVEPLFVPEMMNGMRLLETFKETGRHLALVSDEFGNLQGLVSMNDLVKAIVGDLPEHGVPKPALYRQMEDGSYLVDATMDVLDFKQLVKIPKLPGEESDEFRSVGGFVMTHLGRIPEEGDTFEAAGFRFEIIDMDRHRVDKVLVRPCGPGAVKGRESDPPA